ncbi:MAG: hypothetical protein ABSG57_08450 [Candidatus Bathyarchaeia archaeon]
MLTRESFSPFLALLEVGIIKPQQQQDTIFSTPRSQSLSISPIFTPERTIAAFAITVCIIFGLSLPPQKKVQN